LNETWYHEGRKSFMENTTDYFRGLDLASLWHPYTRHSALRDGFPVIVRGEGVFLFDSAGNRYVDAISSWWACNLGHSHPRLVQAIVRQAGELQHSILGNLTHPRAAELAYRLAGTFPDRHRRTLFASDGASAVEAALRVAVQYWHNKGENGRFSFAALEDAYHGDTIGAMAVGYLPAFHTAYRPLLFPVYKVKTPDCSACPAGNARESCAVECFSSMEHTVEEHAKELAAVVVEPLCQGAAGMRMYPAEYLRRLSELCRENRVLLIVDEIAMGFGRTGRMFAFEHAGIDPDIVCLGKGLSGGYLPISAAVVKEEIFETFSDEPEDHTFYHGHTFAGNPIAAAAAIECLDIYREEKIVEKAGRSGELLAAHFEAFKDVPGVAGVRCLGMIAAFDLTEKEGIAGEDRARNICRTALAKGMLIRPLGAVIYLMPPLIIAEEVLAETVGGLLKIIRN
jgi:adenosylmethionine-8-amino-7-oxononanoate aminotransferase